MMCGYLVPRDVLLPERCLRACVISGNSYHVILFVCQPTFCLLNFMMSAYLCDLDYPFYLWLYLWCLAPCRTWCLVTCMMSTCMMSAYLYDICLLVWCHGGSACLSSSLLPSSTSECRYPSSSACRHRHCLFSILPAVMIVCKMLPYSVLHFLQWIYNSLNFFSIQQ
jgi:hypothetical protein